MARPRYDLSDPEALRHFTRRSARQIEKQREYDRKRRNDPVRKQRQREMRIALRNRRRQVAEHAAARQRFMESCFTTAVASELAADSRLPASVTDQRTWACQGDIVKQLRGELPCPRCEQPVSLAWRNVIEPGCRSCMDVLVCGCHLKPWPEHVELPETSELESGTS